MVSTNFWAAIETHPGKAIQEVRVAVFALRQDRFMDSWTSASRKLKTGSNLTGFGRKTEPSWGIPQSGTQCVAVALATPPAAGDSSPWRGRVAVSRSGSCGGPS